MKPAQFAYHRPTSLDEALALLLLVVAGAPAWTFAVAIFWAVLSNGDHGMYRTATSRHASLNRSSR